MATAERPGLLLRIARELRDLGAALEALDEAAAASLGVSRNDVRALGIAARSSGLPAVAFARRLGLTSASITALIDRMEAKGLLERARDPDDRRCCRIHLTTEGRRRERELYGRLGEGLARWLSRRPAAECGAIAEFLTNARTLAAEARNRAARR